jgi:hypothetical protein
LSLISGTGVFLVLGALVFVNLLGNHFLSDSIGPPIADIPSQKTASSWSDLWKTPFSSNSISPPAFPNPTKARDVIIQDLFKNFARQPRECLGGNHQPDGSDEMDREFRRLNIQAGRFTQVGSDQFQVREGYMALVMHYQDKQEVIPLSKT